MASPHGSPHLSSSASGPSAPGAADEGGLTGDFRVLTPERVSLQYAAAGIGSRSTAALVDTAIQSLVLILLAILFFTLFSPPATRNQGGPATGNPAGAILPSAFWIGLAVVIAVAFLVLVGYYLLFEILWNGQTPGKRLLGLRVIRENGYPIRPVDAVVRNLVRIVDALPTGYAIGLLAMLLNDRAKRLGDFAAGTLVVHEASLPTPASLSSLTAEDIPRPAAVARGLVPRSGATPSEDRRPDQPTPSSSPDTPYRLPTLTPEHATLVRDFLARRNAMGSRARARLAARLAGAIATHYGLESLRASEDDDAFLDRFTAG